VDLPTLRAALWTLRALERTRRALSRDGFAAAPVAAPPPLPASARRGVMAVLRRRRSTCLERALVLQRWDAAHGAASDVIIGVEPSRADGLLAHAWLESTPDRPTGGYREMMRLPAPSA
jgi:hypothetical protein